MLRIEPPIQKRDGSGPPLPKRRKAYEKLTLEPQKGLESYTMQGIGYGYGLQIHRDAQADLRALLGSDESAAGQIVAFLEELRGDQTLLDSLSIRGYEDERITVKWVDKLQHKRWNVWRLTVCDLRPPEKKLPYRILYAFDGPSRVYHILAVKHRSFDYDDATLDRACAVCQDLGIAPLPHC